MNGAAIVACSWGEDPGAVSGLTEELLTLGATVAAARQSDLVWLVLGDLPAGAVEAAGRYGVVRIDRIAHASLGRFEADPCVDAVTQYCRANAPRLLLVGQTFDARLVAPRVAGRLGAVVVMNAVGLEADGERIRVTASAYGGDTRVVYEVTAAGTAIVGLSANAVRPEPRATGGTTPIVHEVTGLDLGAVRERIRVVERSVAEGPRLDHAEIIVAGGRGLGAPENFRLVEALADALGGMAAASRPIVDDGWADRSRQIGLTGKITKPALYIGAGISGASQHMVGCSAAKCIVAINRDPDAAIFRHARYGIVGDCLEVLPALARAAKSR